MVFLKRVGTPIIYTCLLIWLSTGNAFSQNEFEFENEFNYTAEALSFSTPLAETHTEFLGWLHNMSTLKYGNHSLNLSVMITHDNMPSATRMGDIQTFSNLEAGNLYGFNEAYYQFKSEKLTIKLGNQDINSDFFLSNNGLLFAHSSMGIDPVATVNLPIPTYPFTALSFSTSWKLNNLLTLKAGVFDGKFSEHRDRFLPISWTIKKEEGLIYVFEPELILFQNRVNAKFGVYHHSKNFVKKDNSGVESLWGFYAISDIVISEGNQKSTHAYYQFNATTKSISNLDYYIGAGMRFVNALPIACKNELGVGLAYVHVNTGYQSVLNEYAVSSETVLEINWKAKINDNISLQPYFQYIYINDIGTELKEPIVIALRAYLTL